MFVFTFTIFLILSVNRAFLELSKQTQIKPCENCKEDISESEGEGEREEEKEEPEKKRQKKEEMENPANVVYNLQEEMKKIRDTLAEMKK